MNLSNLNHEFIHLSEKDKYRPLEVILREFSTARKQDASSAMIFVNSIQAARSAEYEISRMGFKVSSLHGDIPPNMRKKYFEDFKNKKTEIMIATDLGSRGLDFPFVSYVINLDFPRTVSDYLHRAGRAGRAGRPGFVKSFYRNYDKPIIEEMRMSHEESVPLKISNSAFNLRKENIKHIRTPVQAVSDPEKRKSMTDPLAEKADQNLIINSTDTGIKSSTTEPPKERVLRFRLRSKDALKPKFRSPVKENRMKMKIKKNYDKFQEEQAKIFKPMPHNRRR